MTKAPPPAWRHLPPKDWGRRLTDAIRDALRVSDLAGARRLALEGDGQARGFAKEFTLMFRGLAITARVLLRQVSDVARGSAEGSAVSLVRTFRVDFQACLDDVLDTEPIMSPPRETLDDEIEATCALLERAEGRFARAQEAAAQEFIAALDRGEIDRAAAILDHKESRQYVALHDRLVVFMARVFEWILELRGEGGLLDFHLATAEAMRAGFGKWDAMSPREFAWTTAFLLKQHMGEVAVEETANRFTFRQRLCGSGGRLRAGGAYEGAGSLPFVESPGPLTLGLPRLPVYCSHCPAWNGVAPLRWFGRPQWVFENPAQPDGSCTMHIYKDRHGAPAEYVRLLRYDPPQGPSR